MSKEQKIEVVKRLVKKGFTFEAEIAVHEWKLSKELLKGGKK